MKQLWSIVGIFLFGLTVYSGIGDVTTTTSPTTTVTDFLNLTETTTPQTETPPNGGNTTTTTSPTTTVTDFEIWTESTTPQTETPTTTTSPTTAVTDFEIWTESTTPQTETPTTTTSPTTAVTDFEIWTESTTPQTETPTTTTSPTTAMTDFEIWTETTTPQTETPTPSTSPTTAMTYFEIWTESTTPQTETPTPTTSPTTAVTDFEIWTESTTPQTETPTTTTSPTTAVTDFEIWTETTTPQTETPTPSTSPTTAVTDFEIWTETTTPQTETPTPTTSPTTAVTDFVIWTESTTPQTETLTTGEWTVNVGWTTTTTPPPKPPKTPKPPNPTITKAPPEEIWTESNTPPNGGWTETTTLPPKPPKTPKPRNPTKPQTETPTTGGWRLKVGWTTTTALPPKPPKTSKPPNPTTTQITTTTTRVTESTSTHSPTPSSTTESTDTATTPDLPLTDIFHAKQLIRDFLSDKDVKVRPIDNQSNPIHIKTRFVPVSLIEFDTTNQKFSVLGYFRLAWYDDAISWTKAEYNGLRHMILPSSSVWKPNLIIWKSYSGHGVLGKHSDQIRVGRKGHTQWVPDGTYSVVCDVDIRYYPFDEQFCKIIYYAADETTDTVILNHDAEVDLEELKENENSAWIILSVTRKKTLRKNNYFIEIEFHLTRRTNYAIFTLIVPLLMLASLNVGIFLVPIESGEKGGFAITIFLAYGIFISVLSDKLPHNSLQTSFFVVFITLLLVLSVLSVLYSVIQAKLVISVGAKDTLFGCFRTSAPTSNGDQSVGTVKKSMTWSEFFHKMDIAIFVVLFIIVVVLSLGFFFIMLRRTAA